MKHALACAGLLMLAWPSSLRAEPISLEVDVCLAAERDELRRIVALELHRSLSEPEANVLGIRLRCAEGATVEIEVHGSAGRNAARTVDSGTAITARARLLALAVAEVVAELEAVVPPRPVVSPPVGITKPKPRRERRLQLSAVATGHGFFTGTGFVAGGGVRLVHDLPFHLGWSIDALAEHGAVDTASGQVVVDVVSVDSLLSLHRRWSSFALRGGVGFRGGAVRLEGRATLWGPWAAPVGLLSVAFAPVPRLAIELAVDGGYVVAPVSGHVTADRSVAIDGGFVGFQIAVGTFL